MRRAVAGKARVHGLAKERGVTSKDVLAKLKDLGDFVKSASSTVQAPVAPRLRDSFSAPERSKPARSSGPRPGAGPRPPAPSSNRSGSNNGNGAASAPSALASRPGPAPS